MPDVHPRSAHPTRRRLLTAGLGLAGTTVLLGAMTTGTAAAAPAPGPAPWQGRTSANGWPLIDTATRMEIEGSGLTVLLADGHHTDRAVAQPYESNRLSGTAIAIRPLLYPAGARDGCFPAELTVVRDILADCEGVVRWGGDEKTPKESHFRIDVRPGDRRLPQVAEKISGWNLNTGQGAGATDSFTPRRLRAAADLAARQRTAA
ncbi:hypothetical protein ACQKM2_23195 [Streptomyces sp. NPDC004126]|uniref:hypothetical protein n=1 Tax=Streptomyces sp. NPDC004126 TaxID=3390695 RepID=UPI003D005BC4